MSSTLSGLPPDDDESRAWADLPFVTEGNPWAPASIVADDDTRAYCAECALGAYYAAEFIGHLKRFADTYGDTRLTDMVKAMPKIGAVELGFFSALGTFIASGRINISTDFDAVPCSERESAAETPPA